MVRTKTSEPVHFEIEESSQVNQPGVDDIQPNDFSNPALYGKSYVRKRRGRRANINPQGEVPEAQVEVLEAQVEVPQAQVEVPQAQVESDGSDGTVVPDTTILLRDWENHVAYELCTKTKDRGLLVCKQNTSSIKLWNVEAECDDFKARLKVNPLYNLAKSSYLNASRVITTAFVERWHPETSTFHLPFGEMTITLDDVKYITGLPVRGKALNYDLNKDDELTLAKMVVDCLGIHYEDVVSEMEHHGGLKVSRGWLKNTLAGQCRNRSLKGKAVQTGVTVDQAVRGYLLYLLSCTLFQDRTGDKIRLAYLVFLRDLDNVNDWAWGAAALAHLYRQLSKATRLEAIGVSGYLTLLEAWVYEHFPSERPRTVSDFNDKEMVRSMKWKPAGGMNEPSALVSLKSLRERLDRMGRRDVIWNAYRELRMVPADDITWFYGCIRSLDIVEAYHPNRVVRQFGHVQSVPKHPIPPTTHCTRTAKPKQYLVTYACRDDDFEGYLNHLLHESQKMGVSTVDWECTPNYMTWYRSVVVRRLTDVRADRRQPEDEGSKKKVVDALHDCRQNMSKRSKKDLMKVIDLAYEFLTCGSCSGKSTEGTEVTATQRIDEVQDEGERETRPRRKGRN